MVADLPLCALFQLTRGNFLFPNNEQTLIQLHMALSKGFAMFNKKESNIPPFFVSLIPAGFGYLYRIDTTSIINLVKCDKPHLSVFITL